jgi:hypothetical protein
MVNSCQGLSPGLGNYCLDSPIPRPLPVYKLRTTSHPSGPILQERENWRKAKCTGFEVSSLWGHGSLSECNKCTSSSRRRSSFFSCPLLSVYILSQPKTWEPGDTFNNNKSKKANADPLEQEPDAMSDVTIVTSVVVI